MTHCLTVNQHGSESEWSGQGIDGRAGRAMIPEGLGVQVDSTGGKRALPPRRKLTRQARRGRGGMTNRAGRLGTHGDRGYFMRPCVHGAMHAWNPRH